MAIGAGPRVGPYDISRDGIRFLMLESAAESGSRLNVVMSLMEP